MLMYFRLGVAVLVLSSFSGLCAEEPANPMYQVQVFLQEGDPRGRSELLAKPTFKATARNLAGFGWGGEVSFGKQTIPAGCSMEVTVYPQPSGKVKLRIKAEVTTVLSTDDSELRLQTDRGQFVRETELGEQVRLILSETGNKKRWIDLVVRERE
jgi:hypothetical protein